MTATTAKKVEIIEAAVLARISKSSEKYDKTANQVADCLKLAEKLSTPTVVVRVLPEHIYVDEGLSAFKEGVKRDEYLRAMEDAEARKFSLVLATFEDRMGRQPLEKLGFGAICAEAGITWHTVHDGALDPGTDEGQFLNFMRGHAARKSSLEQQKKIRDFKEWNRSTGVAVGGIRWFGWGRAEVTVDGRRTVLDRDKLNPVEADMVRHAIRRILAGKPRWDVVQMFNGAVPYAPIATTREILMCPTEQCSKKDRMADRYRCTGADQHWRKLSYKWWPASVYDLLTRGVNAGLVEHKGEVVVNADGNPIKGQWEPLVTVKDLYAVRAILAEPVKETSGRPPKSLLSGIAVCACGEVMHAHATSEKGMRVYRCSTQASQWTRTPFEGGHTAIKIDLLDDLARTAVIGSYLTKPKASGLGDVDTQSVADLHESLTAMRDKLATLLDLVVDGEITKAIYVAKKNPLEAQEQELIEQINASARGSAHAAMLIETRRLLAVDGPEWQPADLDALTEGTEPFSHEGRMRSVLGEKFDKLPMEDRRKLVLASVKIQVLSATGRGKGAKRVVIEHRAVPELDDNCNTWTLTEEPQTTA